MFRITPPPRRRNPLHTLATTFTLTVDFIMSAVGALVALIATVFALGVVGWFIAVFALMLDQHVLHWNWPEQRWYGLCIYGSIIGFLLPYVLPAFFQALKVLFQAGLIVAGSSGLVALFTGWPWLPTAIRFGVWFCPAVFVIWLALLVAGKFKDKEEEEDQHYGRYAN